MDAHLPKSDADELTPYRLVFQSVHILIPPGRYLLGRESGCCDIILPHESVSRIHGELIATSTSLLIEDRRSEQGVFINGTRVTRGPLQAGDTLRLGRVQCSVAVEPVEFVDVSAIHTHRNADSAHNDEDAAGPPAPSSEVMPIGDLSQDSVEISATTLEQSLFDQLDESIDDLPVVPADNVTQHQPDASTARPAPLPRQRFPVSEDPASRKSPYRRADGDSGGSPLAGLVSTTAGKLAVLMILGWGSYGALHLLGDPHAPDREVAARLQHFSDVIGDLRSNQAPPSEWAELRKSVEAELPQIIQELERRASSEQPVTQNLLRAARDCLPRMLQPTPEPTWYEERFDEYLAQANMALARH